MTFREKIADQIAHGVAADLPSVQIADAVLDAMAEPSMGVLQAGYEAMFIDKWDGTQAPMMGAGFDAMIAAAKEEGR